MMHNQRKIKNILLICMFLMNVPAAMGSQEIQILRMSFQDALQMAQGKEVNAIVASKQVEQAILRLGEVRSALLPQVTGSLSESRQTRNLQASGISLPQPNPVVGPFNTFDARIKITQILFDAAAIERLLAARDAKQMSVAALRKAKQDAMALVALFYIQAKRAQDSVVFRETILKRDQDELRIVKSCLESGTGSSLELKQAEAALMGSRRLLQSASANAENRRLDLLAALGFPAGQLIEFVPDDLRVPNSLDKKSEVEADIQKTPDMEVAAQLLKQRQSEKHAEMAEFLPKLSGSGDWGASGKSPSDSEWTYSIGAQVIFPIFESGHTWYRVREAASKVSESEVKLKDTERHVESKILQQKELLKEASFLVDQAKSELEVAETKCALAEHRLQTGIGSEIEILQARADEAAAKDKMEEAIATYQTAKVNFAHASGKMELLITKEEKHEK